MYVYNTSRPDWHASAVNVMSEDIVRFERSHRSMNYYDNDVCNNNI